MVEGNRAKAHQVRDVAEHFHANFPTDRPAPVHHMERAHMACCNRKSERASGVGALAVAYAAASAEASASVESADAASGELADVRAAAVAVGFDSTAAVATVHAIARAGAGVERVQASVGEAEAPDAAAAALPPMYLSRCS